MAFVFEIKPNSGDSHQTSPDWMMVVVRYAHRSTFNPNAIEFGLSGANAGFIPQAPTPAADPTPLQSSILEAPPRPQNISSPVSPINSSLADAIAHPVAELDVTPLIIDTSIKSFSINNGKSEHVKSMEVQLFNDASSYPGLTNWTKDLSTGDWVLFFAFDNQEDKERVKANVQNLKQINNFNDGLKFIGRIKGVKRIRNRNSTGVFSVSYQLTANSFSEFDSIIYFNEIMKSKYDNEPLQWMIDLSTNANNFILNANAKGGIDSNKALPGLVQICLGLGPTGSVKGLNEAVASSFEPGSNEARVAVKTQTTPNVAYRIPNSIATLLGTKADPKAHSVGYTYSDLLRMYIGVQGYIRSPLILKAPQIAPAGGNGQWEPFIPFLSPLDGDFSPYTININQSTCWSLLSTYLNKPINEMYTVLRVSSDGSIMPCFVARQIPFSSDLFNRTCYTKRTTSFLDLPRWSLDERLVTADHLGTSDALRTNFVHFLGQDTHGGDSLYNQTLGYSRHDPIVDVVDICRNGVFPMERQVSANDIESNYPNNNSPGKFWTVLMADALINNHLRWTGIIETKGIQAPIAEGDNLQYDGGIYHIERVTHSGSINPTTGTKTFNSSIHVSYGISTLSDTDHCGYNVYLTSEFDQSDGDQPVNPGLTIDK